MCNATSVSAVEPEDAERQAIRKVIERYKEYGNKVSTLTLECLRFTADLPSDDLKILVSAHEIHNEKCGGDPLTDDRLFKLFEVVGDRIFIMEMITGEYVPFDSTYKPYKE